MDLPDLATVRRLCGEPTSATNCFMRSAVETTGSCCSKLCVYVPRALGLLVITAGCSSFEV
eukprot:12806742-Alexandrium_andersonii.AAC.1